MSRPHSSGRADPARRADDVAERRARIKRYAGLAKRIGYLCLLGAVVAFAVALVTGLAGWAVTTTVALLVAACVILPAPIVIGYGIRAADREDREAARQRARRERGNDSDGRGSPEWPGGRAGTGAP